LPFEAFVGGARFPLRGGAGPWTIVGVGRLAQMYKGVDTLLEAIARCRSMDLDVRLVWAGDGRYRAVLERQAASLGVGEAVSFVGEVPAGAGVRAVLDGADLFVIPSRTEGLPRALIEAMARGLPCIGTCVGGIPELLPESDLVAPDDPEALAERIRAVLLDPGRRDVMSERNLARAREFRSDLLRERRNAFYRELRSRSAHSIG
jgi:glycosyltransferase involved in cell wall biosynthesis